MSDIVEELRIAADWGNDGRELYEQAADEIERLRAALRDAHDILRKVPGALSDAFNAGMEECEGGSWRRQALHMKSVEDLRTEIRAALPKG